MRPIKILLTNDDGPKAPFVRPFVAALRRAPWCADLRAVFPAEEQSWIGQAVTRFRPLYITEHDFDGLRGHLVSGTPADCVGLGLYDLHADFADIVFSGINVGTNATLPFYLNSGTIGGARQALTFGVRGIGFSALVPEKIFHAWREDDHTAMAAHEADWQRLADVCTHVGGMLLADECWRGVDLYSVNVPWLADRATPIALTGLARSTYKGLYRKRSDGGYEHHLAGFTNPIHREGARELLPDDLATMQGGTISVTPIHYELSALSAETTRAIREAINEKA